MNRLFHLTLAVATLGLGACSTIKVSTRSSRVTREGIASANVLRQVAGAPLSALATLAESSAGLLESAAKLESRGAKVDAAGAYLKAAIESREVLLASGEKRGSEAEEALIQIHNRALARFAELWIEDPRRLSPGPYRLSSGADRMEISLAKSSTYPRDFFDRFVPAEAVEEKGIVNKTRFGIGAAGVGIREPRPGREGEMTFYPKRGLHVPITLTMDTVTKTGGMTRATFSMRNPMVEESLVLAGRTYPVAADFTAPIAVLLQGRNEELWGLGGFFKAAERAKISGIVLTEPYDPGRIPVLLIHGLISVPIIWRDIVPELASEPDLSERYQFMVFTYPSSYPVIESAKLLRDQLAALRAHYDPDGKDPLSTNMVVAGHSMGGILTHTLVAEFGDHLWNQFSDQPIDALPIPEEEKEVFRSLAYFDPDPAVRRAVYFSAPHRGAKMAEKSISGLISGAAALPADVLRATAGVLDPRLKGFLKIPPTRAHITSVQSLEPGAPMVAALDKAPYKKGVIYHSIIGDRGRGDTPHSSDGVVEYWSSRQDGAASELIVPTDHGSYKHPKAIAELKRILREHAGLRR